MRFMRIRAQQVSIFALLALLCLAGCGGESPAQPDSVVAIAITSRQEMPFHSSAGPGNEPIYIHFWWTVGLTVEDGPGVAVRAIRTELREPNYSGSLAVATESDAFNGQLGSGAPLMVPQTSSGLFSSALYPGEWQGNVSVDIVHPSGRAETLQTAFSFR